MQRLFLVTALVLVTAPVATGAQPGQDGGGWQMWEYRATGLKTAMEQADLHLLDVHCTQVGRVLTRSGVRFPTWAHSLRTACAAVRNIFEPIGDRRRYRLVCHDLKQAAKDLGKA
ncbi:MAG: hypothetical protein EON59_14300, partial [Alphaproteobacteria bacterium]